MARIGIFDSGAGGLSVFREIKKLLPEENYIYFGDNANCPYGEKGQDFIIRRSCEICDFLISRNVSAIVVACNTATTSAISFLRERYDIPFIGIEPAIKPAVTMTKTGVIGVLATNGTLNAEKYMGKKSLLESKVRIIERTGKGFVDLVESLKLEGTEAESVIAECIAPIMEAGADTLVLGCTHYPFLTDSIGKVAERMKLPGIPGISIIDPAPAVARHLKDVLCGNGIPLTDEKPGTELIASGSDDTLRKLYSRFLV